MSFLESLFSSILVGEDASPVNFRAVICGDRSGYFENVKAIKSFNDTEIVLMLKKGTITLKGKGLFIKKYCGEDICIGGEILSLEVENSGGRRG